MRKYLIALFLLTTLVYAQDKQVQPTEIEQAKLGKLKAQSETLQTQLQQIDTQLQALNILKQLTTEHQQQKYSQLLTEVEKIKQAHKEWGSPDKVIYNSQQTENGAFTVKEETKTPDKK